MKRFNSLIIALVISVAIAGCWPKVFNKKDFALYGKTNVSANPLNGYYYAVDRANGALSVRVLLKDGFVKDYSGSYISGCEQEQNSLQCQLDHVERRINQSQDTLRIWKNKKYHAPQSILGKSPIELWGWGKYEINNGKVVMLYFYNHLGDYYLMEERGEILSDRSFVIKEIKDYYDNETTSVNEIYEFKEFDVENLYRKAPRRLNNARLEIR